MMSLLTKQNALYVYYLVLLIVMASWTNMDSSPSMPLRICFLMALVIPSMIQNVELLPSILTCFVFVSSYGFSSSYMPTSYDLYAILLLLCAVVNKCFSQSCSKYRPLLFFALFVSFVDVVTWGKVERLTFCLLVLYLFLVITNKSILVGKVSTLVKSMAISFAVASLVIVYYYFVFGSLFTISYGSDSGLERTSWIDPNYLSTVLGMSVMSSSIVLISSLRKSVFEKVLFCIAMILSFIVMVMCASRGGIVSISVGFFALLLLSKMRLMHKVLIMLLLVVFVFYLLYSGYFDLLEYRIQNDTEGGSGRTEIWAMKLNSFMDGDNFFDMICGLGFRRATYLGGNTTSYQCFHNDFIAYFVSYGVIGLFAFVCFLLYPLKLVKNNFVSRSAVVASLLYLVACSMTLNPLSEGYIVYFCFFYFIILLSHLSDKYVKE